MFIMCIITDNVQPHFLITKTSWQFSSLPPELYYSPYRSNSTSFAGRKMDQQQLSNFSNLRLTEDEPSTLNPVNELDKNPGWLSADGAEDEVDSFAINAVSYSQMKNIK